MTERGEKWKRRPVMTAFLIEYLRTGPWRGRRHESARQARALRRLCDLDRAGATTPLLRCTARGAKTLAAALATGFGVSTAIIGVTATASGCATMPEAASISARAAASALASASRCIASSLRTF